MDVSTDLAAYAEKHTTNVLERSVPIEVDAGLLAAFDTTPIDVDAYSSNLAPHLHALTQTSTQSLLTHLWALPHHPSPLGTAIRPGPPVTILPREKPLPKKKEPTKWERFANAKGISHKTREKSEWDEEKQAWVDRWGRGRRREGEEWAVEIKQGMDADLDPTATARAAQKARVSKNAKQHLANLSTQAHPQTKTTSREIRKSELNRTALLAKTSTASMGKFDKSIENEPKAKGVKRKFDAVIAEAGKERDEAMSVLKSVESGKGREKKKKGETGEGDLNFRKAVRGVERAERGRGGGRGGRGGSGRGRGGGGRGGSGRGRK